MKIINLSVLALSVALSTTACNTPSSGDSHSSDMHGEHGHEGHDHNTDDMEHTKKTSAEVVMTETTLNETTAASLVGDYLNMKKALTNDNSEDAKASATNMMNTLEGSQDELGKKLLFDAEHIATTTDLGHQRDHFEVLSRNVYALASQVKTGKELYWQHCPMAFEGQGANWISAEEEIRNPYFGSRMLKCGKVEEKI